MGAEIAATGSASHGCVTFCGDANQSSLIVNELRIGPVTARVYLSMRNDYLVCSLLLAFSVSVVNLGCDSGAKPASPSTTESKSTGNAASTTSTSSDDKPAGKKTAKKPKKSGTSSTTGAGVDVPADAGGAAEKPAAEKPAEKPAADAPAETKPEEKTEAKPEEKTEAKPEDK